MQKYICKECGEVFTDPCVKYESKVGLTTLHCPWCDSERVEFAGECQCCGTPIDPEEEYCIKCDDGLYKIMEKAVEEVMTLSNKDSEESKAILNEYISEVWG